MKKEKYLMSNKKFSLMWISISVILVGLVVAATIVMNFYKVSMDNYLGMGKKVIHQLEIAYNQVRNFNY